MNNKKRHVEGKDRNIEKTYIISFYIRMAEQNQEVKLDSQTILSGIRDRNLEWLGSITSKIDVTNDE